MNSRGKKNIGMNSVGMNSMGMNSVGTKDKHGKMNTDTETWMDTEISTDRVVCSDWNEANKVEMFAWTPLESGEIPSAVSAWLEDFP